LETALERSADARDIAKDLLRRLPDYDGSEEEDTARRELPAIHVHLDSVHESEPPVKKQIRAGLIAIGSGIGLAILTGVAALAQSCGHH
jgi:hypothetical protein